MQFHKQFIFAYLAASYSVQATQIAEPLAAENATVHTIYRFPNGTWLENLAVRSSGTVLVTLLTKPEVWEIDPVSGSAELITIFPNATGALGIAEVSQDVFTVNVGNFTVETVSSIPGTWSVWKLDLRQKDSESYHAQTQSGSPKASAHKITDIPAAKQLDGMCALPGQAGTILTADPGHGRIYRVDAETGQYGLWLEDSAFKPNATAEPKIGINGIQTLGDFLYFTNSVKVPTFGRLPFSGKTGNPSGPVEVIFARPSYPVNIGFHADDFALSSNGIGWITTNPSNTVVKATPDGAQAVIAGGLRDPALAGATSAKFGRTPSTLKTLYITTNGGLNDPASAGQQGGELAAIEV